MARSRTYLLRAMMVSVIAAVGLVSAAASAFAYPPPPPTVLSITATNCTGTIPAGGSCTITVMVDSAGGVPLPGAVVNWTVPCGTVTPNPSTTDANGNTTVTYQAPAAGCGCPAGPIVATSGNVSTSVTVNVACTGTLNTLSTGTGTLGAGKLLPSAGAVAPGGGSAGRWILIAVAMMGMLVAVGGTARLRRSRRLAA